MQKNLITSIDLAFTPEQVWEVLTQLEKYGEWNPFIIRSSGKIRVGEMLQNTMMNGAKEITFKPRVLQVEENRHFEWLGHLWFKGVFDGRHYFKLEASEKGTRLTHGENFSGLLSGLILKQIGEQTKQNFIQMNEALEKELERRFAG
ncbi:MAG: SRPBCC domain-containing protein [Bacteroidetes bacterium]|nr:MAG: SRPBCC domain-containing protein [Bacteroidota bacterium]